ncbi:helix-turn-helix domain-containing protein [Clostridium butyricum]|uniref:helix-turn-helix domain-containing protein n=1 Tax=Clostridium butyricum TaxID=1492 RepID=UPI002AAFF96E|nr:helix-turn-helix transcriptional regulator [Clostridium butyricum]
MDDLNIGKRIRLAREQNNLTRDVLAEKIGISKMYLSQLEKGQRHASLPVTIKIAESLNLSLDYLIYGNSFIDIDKQELIDMINSASNRQLKIIKEILLNLKK